MAHGLSQSQDTLEKTPKKLLRVHNKGVLRGLINHITRLLGHTYTPLSSPLC